MKKVLAFDMGATSIRGILAYIEDGKLICNEVMRFSHKIVKKDERMRWQWQDLIDKVKKTIIEYADEIYSIGIDTWGVDFGIIDKEGNLISDPVSYRDSQNEYGYKEAIKFMSEEEIFLNTGNQIMNINTLFQLIAMEKVEKDRFNAIDTLLMMPDLFQYILTGEKVAEETILSTSQLIDLRNNEFSDNILKTYVIKREIFPKKVRAGHITGSTKNSLIKELREYDIKVVSVCGHDTASAVLMTKAFIDEDYMFLSCGTWSLIGALSKTKIDKEIYSKNLTNETGYDSKNMLFKNITGLYLLEKYKEQLEEQLNRKIEFDEITKYVLDSNNETPLINPDDKRFAAQEVIAKKAIDEFLSENNKDLPKNDFDYFKIIYESLVNKYLKVKTDLEEILNKRYKKLHMIGGGAKSELLCRLIAKKLDVELIAGPFEASALGNIIVQLKAIGEINDIKEGIELALKTQETKEYK